MVISTSHRFVYCAVPKVASRALRSLFEPFIDEAVMDSVFKNSRAKSGNIGFHNPVGVRRKMRKVGLDPDGFFWFGFVRNPWDRTVSRYKFEHERAANPAMLVNVSEKHMDYHQSMIHLSWEDYLEKALYFPQSHWLRDKQGVVVERVFRMECLPDAIREIAARLGCDLDVPPVQGATERDRDYRKYFENDRQIELVARHYAEDVLLGGYRFDGSFGESYDLRRIVSRNA